MYSQAKSNTIQLPASKLCCRSENGFQSRSMCEPSLKVKGRTASANLRWACPIVGRLGTVSFKKLVEVPKVVQSGK